jgi:hypothetical protein
MLNCSAASPSIASETLANMLSPQPRTKKAQLGKLTLSGDGLCIGRDSDEAVSEEYKRPRELKGGTIHAVGVTVEKAQYLDPEKLAAAALAVD